MRKILAALVLAFLFTGTTAGHAVAPPLDRNTLVYKPVPDFEDEKNQSAFIIEDYLSPIPSVGVPKVAIPSPKAIIEPVATPQQGSGKWLHDPVVSWYGPGFYGKRTACGLAYTKTIIGFAHKTWPCGTKVQFKWGKKIIIAPVIDRGPYVAGRQFDLSGGLCTYLDHCFTGPIDYRRVNSN